MWKRISQVAVAVSLLAITVSCSDNPTLNTPKPSFSTHKIDKYEAYGDSLTIGFFADRKSLTDPSLSLSDVENAYSSVFWTLGTERGLLKLSKPELAWPTRLKESLSPSTPIDNRAVPNASSSDLTDQVRKGGSSVNDAIALFFMGHNDICDLVQLSDDELVNQFTQNFSRALDDWSSRHSRSIAYLVPVGDIGRLYMTLWDYEWTKGQKCSDTYLTHIPFCSRLAKMGQKGSLAAFTKKRTDKLNLALRKLAIEKSNGNAGGNVFHFVEGMENIEIRPSFFALDCFHFSEEGQKFFAEKVKNAIR
jgi:lysophospholipase L1-like esterase